MRNLALLCSASLLASCAAVADRGTSTGTSRGSAEPASHPNGMAAVSYAFGKTDVDSKGANGLGNDDTGAAMARAVIDAGGDHFGGGVHVDWTLSKDDLFETQNQANSGGKLTALDVYPFFTFRPTGGDKFRIPIRIGPNFQVQHFEANQGGNEVDFATIAGAVEVEPEYDFFRNNDQALSIYGAARGGYGAGAVKLTQQGVGDETYDTKSTSIALELGMRYQIKKFLITGGFLSRASKYDETDPSTKANFPTTVGETDIKYTGFFVGGGVRW